MSLVRTVLAISTLGLLLGGGAFAKMRFLPENALVPGLRIDGEVVAGRSLDAYVGEKKKALEQRVVKIVAEGDERRVLAELPLGKLGVTVDQEVTAARARAVAHEGTLFDRVAVAREARAEHVNVPLALRQDPAALVELIDGLKEHEDVSPQSARLDLDKREVIAEKDGRYLDSWGALERLDTLVRTGGDRLIVPVSIYKPRISSEYVKSLDISQILGEYETYFSRGGDQARRGKNIDVASSKLDGIVISPGELMSFNTIVGERSEAAGFQKSWEIFKGEMVEGVGGGTCQVASTFHAAIFFAGLDVTERFGHSRPSAYIPMGLDSTVVYPSVDLKIRNPYPFPVVIHTHTDGNKLRVEVLGKERVAKVAFGRDVLAIVPFKRRVEEEGYLTGKRVIVKQHGIRGYRIRRSRTLTFNDGTKKVESTNDFYPPTTEIYQVPAGFDTSLLPALPEEGGDDATKAPKCAKDDATCQPKPAEPNAVATRETKDAKAKDAPKPDVEFVDAPGAHAPTAAQADPTKSLYLAH